MDTQGDTQWQPHAPILINMEYYTHWKYCQDLIDTQKDQRILSNIQGNKALWELVEPSLTTDPEDSYRQDDMTDILG